MCVSAGKVFGPLHFTRHDLTVLTTMRGRDHGVLDYNSARAAYGLPTVDDFADINPWLNGVNPQVSFGFYFALLTAMLNEARLLGPKPRPKP